MTTINRFNASNLPLAPHLSGGSPGEDDHWPTLAGYLADLPDDAGREIPAPDVAALAAVYRSGLAEVRAAFERFERDPHAPIPDLPDVNAGAEELARIGAELLEAGPLADLRWLARSLRELQARALGVSGSGSTSAAAVVEPSPGLSPEADARAEDVSAIVSAVFGMPLDARARLAAGLRAGGRLDVAGARIDAATFARMAAAAGVTGPAAVSVYALACPASGAADVDPGTDAIGASPARSRGAPPMARSPEIRPLASPWRFDPPTGDHVREVREPGRVIVVGRVTPWRDGWGWRCCRRWPYVAGAGSVGRTRGPLPDLGAALAAVDRELAPVFVLDGPPAFAVGLDGDAVELAAEPLDAPAVAHGGDLGAAFALLGALAEVGALPRALAALRAVVAGGDLRSCGGPRPVTVPRQLKFSPHACAREAGPGTVIPFRPAGAPLPLARAGVAAGAAPRPVADGPAVRRLDAPRVRAVALPAWPPSGPSPTLSPCPRRPADGPA